MKCSRLTSIFLFDSVLFQLTHTYTDAGRIRESQLAENNNTGNYTSKNKAPVAKTSVRAERELEASATIAWHPNYSAGWSLGHCVWKADTNTLGYSSELECCKRAYPDQFSAYCLSQLPNPPTSPTDDGGPHVWYADYSIQDYSKGVCINERPPPNGQATYDSQLSCCTAVYDSQISGKCISQVASSPALSLLSSGGLDVWYADYSIQDYSEGVCTNERPLPNGRATYDSQLSCCKAAYGDQISGKCLSKLPNSLTVSPTSSGGVDVYYADYSKPYAKGVCTNKAPLPAHGVVTYASQEICCSSAYESQSSLTCLCDLPDPPAACWVKELDDAECIYQRHFAEGTKVITKPGSYKLCEDIVFAPGEPNFLTASDSEIANAFNPVSMGDEQYNKKEFGLGYFSALAIAVNDVSLMLNGYTIQQAPSHALMQRFFAVIELASSPFIPKVGPADFVSDAFVPAENFSLRGPGTIGLSSHHGIHGNNNKNVAIENVIFRDFEVAAVSLNNVDGLIIDNCNIPHNRLDVPVLGAFSAALNMVPYLKALQDSPQPYSMPLRGVSTNSSAVYDSLVTAIGNVYRDVMTRGFINPVTHPGEYALFHNPHHVVDGPCYVFLVHGKGPAIGGQGFELSSNSTTTSSNVKISNNNIEQIVCWTNEVPSPVINSTVQNDARGSIIQLISTVTNSLLASDSSYRYSGNVVTDAQIMVASAIHDGVLKEDSMLQIEANKLSPEIVAWATDPSATFVPSFRCNGDTMHHVVKGSIMIRVEDTEGFHIEGNSIGSALVKSGPAAASSEYFASFPGTQLQWTCTDFHKGASVEDGTEQQLGNLRGISVAAVSGFVNAGKSTISGNALTQFKSDFANSILGIDVQGMSTGIMVSGNFVNLKQGAGFTTDDQYIACRVRRFASQENITKKDNIFFHEEVFEQIQDRRLRSPKIPAHHPALETEWEYGGCPFGRA